MKKVIEITDYAYPVVLEQHEDKRALFRVTYGKEVHDGLTYTKAAAEFGLCLMHALACCSLIETTSANDQ